LTLQPFCVRGDRCPEFDFSERQLSGEQAGIEEMENAENIEKCRVRALGTEARTSTVSYGIKKHGCTLWLITFAGGPAGAWKHAKTTPFESKDLVVETK